MEKEKRIEFRVSVKDLEKINLHARFFGLATGTYLRLLGLSGQSPFAATRSQGRIVMDAREYEGLEAQPLDRGAEKPNPRRKRTA